MSPVGRYAGVGLALVLGASALLWPWLEPDGRRGVLLAAAVAWPVQVLAFGLLVRRRDELNRFLAAWVGGTVVRMGLIGLVAFVLLRLDGVATAPGLLALAGYFFGLLLLEPVFFRAAVETEAESDAVGIGHDNDGT